MNSKSAKKSGAVFIPGVVLLGFFFFFDPAPAHSGELPEVQTYDELVHAIRDIRRSTNPEIKREKVREVWTIGKLIELHAAEYTLWADYHAYLIKKLSHDLNMKPDDLRRIRRFARAYPDAVPPYDLDWWHYQALLDIHDPIQRDALAASDEKEKWTSDKLQAELRKLREKYRPPRESPESPALSGKLNYYAATVTQVLD